MGDNERKLKVALGVLIGAALERNDVRQVIGIYPFDGDDDDDAYGILFEMLDPALDEVPCDIFEGQVAELDRAGLDAWVQETLTSTFGEDVEPDDDEDEDQDDEEEED